MATKKKRKKKRAPSRGLRPEYEQDGVSIYLGECVATMQRMADNTYDSIVTDCPYELGFMGKDWDAAGVAFDPATWAECLRVAKPGAFLATFGGTRTYHRIACAVEDAGWEIRDSLALMWMYGQGFPKSLSISKAFDKAAGIEPVEVKPAKGVGFMNKDEDGWNNTANQIVMPEPTTPLAKAWDGWGTALKPSFEPIILARKPFPGSVHGNVEKHGTGGINIDACRVGSDKVTGWNGLANGVFEHSGDGVHQPQFTGEGDANPTQGRWPANVVMACGCEDKHHADCPVARLGDESKFYYTAKPARSEKEAGLKHRKRRIVNDGRKTDIDNPYQRGDTERVNIHPTVKPRKLMQWLVTLTTPEGGLLLDPFGGSGTTGIGALFAGARAHLIEMDPEYVSLAADRLREASADTALERMML